MLKELVQFIINQSAAIGTAKDLPAHTRVVSAEHSIASIERHLPLRARFRTQVETKVIDDFVALTTEKKDVAQCFIDTDRMTAKSIFNLGDEDQPGHGDHWVRLEMEKTVEYTEVLKIDGKGLDQTAMAEWLEDWVEFLTPVYSSDVEKDMKKAIIAIRNVKIDAGKTVTSSVQTFAAEQSEVEKIQAKGANDAPLPEGFIFKCISYHGLQVIQIPLRVSMITSGREPAFKMRIVKQDQIQHHIVEEFRDLLAEKLSTIKVTIGTVSLGKE